MRDATLEKVLNAAWPIAMLLALVVSFFLGARIGIVAACQKQCEICSRVK